MNSSKIHCFEWRWHSEPGQSDGRHITGGKSQSRITTRRRIRGREDIYPVPLSVLVQKYDDQLGEHLVAFFTEWQVPTLKCHIHNIPVGKKEHWWRIQNLLWHGWRQKSNSVHWYFKFLGYRVNMTRSYLQIMTPIHRDLSYPPQLQDPEDQWSPRFCRTPWEALMVFHTLIRFCLLTLHSLYVFFQSNHHSQTCFCF